MVIEAFANQLGDVPFANVCPIKSMTWASIECLAVDCRLISRLDRPSNVYGLQLDAYELSDCAQFCVDVSDDKINLAESRHLYFVCDLRIGWSVTSPTVRNNVIEKVHLKESLWAQANEFRLATTTPNAANRIWPRQFLTAFRALGIDEKTSVIGNCRVRRLPGWSTKDFSDDQSWVNGHQPVPSLASWSFSTSARRN